MELQLVEELRAVAADEVEKAGGAFARELVRAADVEPPRQPGRLVGEVLEQHRPALGDCVVAEPPFLHRQVRGSVGEVLRVAGLVEEGPPVVGAADRLDDEHHLARHLDGRAEGAR